MYFDGQDAALKRALYREALGYVSQNETLHGDLTVNNAVQFTGELRLRGIPDVESLVTRLLDEGEVPYPARDKHCNRLFVRYYLAYADRI